MDAESAWETLSPTVLMTSYLPVLDVVHAMRPALFDLVNRVHHEVTFGQVGGGAPRRLNGKAQFQEPAGQRDRRRLVLVLHADEHPPLHGEEGTRPVLGLEERPAKVVGDA